MQVALGTPCPRLAGLAARGAPRGPARRCSPLQHPSSRPCLAARAEEEGSKVVREYREADDTVVEGDQAAAEQKQEGAVYAEENYVVSRRRLWRAAAAAGCPPLQSAASPLAPAARAAAASPVPPTILTPCRACAPPPCPQPRDTMSKEMKERLRREYVSFGGSPSTPMGSNYFLW